MEYSRNRPSSRPVARRWLVLTAVLAVAAAACVPPVPSVPPPSLPAGVGVEWLRDQGGTINDDGDLYLADFARYSLLDGVTTGPTPVGSSIVTPVTVAELGFLNSPASRPDGTAMQPWNGFAGEGINLIAPAIGEGEWVLEFPGGSCSLGFVDQFSNIRMVSPSPDGTKAVVRRNEDSPLHRIAVVSLVDGATCPEITGVQYSADFPASPTAASAGNAFVWSPDSSAVAYSLFRASDGLHHIVRLAAAPGVDETDLVPPASDGLLPMGWSTAGRLLFSRTSVQTDGTRVSKLVTRSVAGGSQRVIDTVVEPNFWLTGNTTIPVHFGYYVPGTTSIVYNDGSSTVTNSDGLTFPWFDIRLIADAANAVSKSIHGTRLPLVWHQVPVFDPPAPVPYTVTDVPNVEFLERFIH